MKHRPSYSVIVARLENERADTPHSRSRIPRPGLRPGWNLEDTPSALRTETPGFATDLSARAETAIARKIALAQGRGAVFIAPCAPALTGEDEKKIPMSFSPPRFKTLKKGPRAGQTVEETWSLHLTVRTVRIPGGQTWTASARHDHETMTLIPPSSGKVGTPPPRPDEETLATAKEGKWSRERIQALYPPDLRPSRSFTHIFADLKSRYGAAEADRLTAFLRFAD